MNEKKKFRIAVRKFDPFEKAIEKIWKSFCEKTGCDLKLEAVAMDLHPLYDATIKNEGLKNGDWDVAFINTDWITEAVENKHVENLSPFIEQGNAEEFLAGWSASLRGMQEFDGKVYGLPLHDGPECLIYRKDLLESEEEKKAFEKAYQRPLTVPQTWDELQEVAEFFHRPSQGLYGTAFAAYPDGHNTVFDYCLQLWARGGKLMNEAGQIMLNSAAALEGMTYYRSILQNSEVIHPDFKELDSVKAGMAFAHGEIALLVNWFGFASMCEVYEGSKVKGKVDITQVPAGSSETQGISLNVYWMYVLGSGATDKKLAYDFIQFATNQENDKLLTMEGGIGCRISTWKDAEVNEAVPYYHKLETLHQNTETLPRVANWAEIADVIDQLVLEVMNTEKDIQQILDDAQSKIFSIT